MTTFHEIQWQGLITLNVFTKLHLSHTQSKHWGIIQWVIPLCQILGEYIRAGTPSLGSTPINCMQQQQQKVIHSKNVIFGKFIGIFSIIIFFKLFEISVLAPK